MTKFTTEIGFKGFRTRRSGRRRRGLPARGRHLVFGYFFARMAQVARAKSPGNTDPFPGKLQTARFYFAKLFPRPQR